MAAEQGQLRVRVRVTVRVSARSENWPLIELFNPCISLSAPGGMRGC